MSGSGPFPCTPRTAALHAFAAALLVFAGAAAGQNCTFRPPPANGIVFAPFDPSLASLQTASTIARVRCVPPATPPTWTFAGLNGNAPLRMKHASLNAFIPYSVSTQLLGGPPNARQWRITATVLGPDYENAPVGAYSDLLTATILP
jgi:hypothetical protein